MVFPVGVVFILVVFVADAFAFLGIWSSTRSLHIHHCLKNNWGQQTIRQTHEHLNLYTQLVLKYLTDLSRWSEWRFLDAWDRKLMELTRLEFCLFIIADGISFPSCHKSRDASQALWKISTCQKAFNLKLGHIVPWKKIVYSILNPN